MDAPPARRTRGGSVILCVIFAAASGVVGATESVVGLLAIPVMLRYAYDKGLISGTICAGGSLGTIIPPSVVVVILGPVADVDVGGRTLRIRFDPLQKRVLMFELKKTRTRHPRITSPGTKTLQ